MHMNVNITNMCILLFYSLGRVVWLATWQWRAGKHDGAMRADRAGILMCRLMRVLEQFSFSISSYVLLVIAVERAHSLYNPLTVCSSIFYCPAKPHLRQAPHFLATYVRPMLVGAYALAAITSLPQYIAWALYLAQ